MPGVGTSVRWAPTSRWTGRRGCPVNPIHPANTRICDLKLAQRNGMGLVEFAADLSVVLPVDARQTNGRCIVELPNRGRRRVAAMMNCAPPDAPVGPQAHPGDGFCSPEVTPSLRRRNGSSTLARSSCALPRPLPWRVASPSVDETMVEIRPNERATTQLLADRIHRPLPAAPGEQLDARLLVRDWEDGEDTLIPRLRLALRTRDRLGDCGAIRRARGLLRKRLRTGARVPARL